MEGDPLDYGVWYQSVSARRTDGMFREMVVGHFDWYIRKGFNYICSTFVIPISFKFIRDSLASFVSAFVASPVAAPHIRKGAIHNTLHTRLMAGQWTSYNTHIIHLVSVSNTENSFIRRGEARRRRRTALWSISQAEGYFQWIFFSLPFFSVVVGVVAVARLV